MLLARKAEQMGMRMTDDEITRFLQMLTNNSVTAERFSEILTAISGRRGGITRRQLYDALRTELLANRLSSGFTGSQQTTPAERWEAYQKLHSRASIEAISVAVADFLDKVAEPDNTAVQTLYDNYKPFEPALGSPVPGFKIPGQGCRSIHGGQLRAVRERRRGDRRGSRERIRKEQGHALPLYRRPRAKQR